MDEATAQRVAEELNERIETGQAYATNWHGGRIEEDLEEDEEFVASRQDTWQVHIIPDPLVYMVLDDEPEDVDEVAAQWNQESLEFDEEEES